MKSSCLEGCKRYVDEVCGDSLVVDLLRDAGMSLTAVYKSE